MTVDARGCFGTESITQGWVQKDPLVCIDGLPIDGVGRGFDRRTCSGAITGDGMGSDGMGSTWDGRILYYTNKVKYG